MEGAEETSEVGGISEYRAEGIIERVESALRRRIVGLFRRGSSRCLRERGSTNTPVLPIGSAPVRGALDREGRFMRKVRKI